MLLKLKHNTTNRVYELDTSVELKGHYAYADIELPELYDGEYDYELINNGKTLARGICQIGQVVKKHQTTEYDNEIKYKQYNG